MGLYNGNTISLEERPRIGINLEDASYFSAETPFNNLAMVSFWVSSSGFGYGNGVPLSVNASGLPSGTFPFNHSATFLLQLGSGVAPGFYNVSWTPTNASVSARNSVHNTYTFLKGTGVANYLIDVASGITSLAVHRSGDPTNYSSVFREPYIRRMRNFDTLRFMDWTRTNYERGGGVTWENRVQPGYYTQSLSTGSGVAFEHIIDLCNQTDCNPWICIHHQATTDYVIHLAELFKQRLNPGLKVYLEHSNEVWNGQFPANQYAIDNGPSGIADQYVRGMAYHQRKTAEYAQIFKASGVPTVSVFAWQSAAGGGYIDYAVGQGFVPSGSPLVDAVAIAPYFGVDVSDANVISGCKAFGIQWTIGECWHDMQVQRDRIKTWVSGAAKWGWDLLGYEGGQHLAVLGSQHSDAVLTQNFTDANRSQDMYELYRAYLQMWQEETNNGLMCLFNSSYPSSHFGNWGLTEFDNQKDAPKYRAVMDHIAQFRPAERGRY